MAALISSNTGTDAEAGMAAPESNGLQKSVSNAPAARINDSPSPSIGVMAARLMDVGKSGGGILREIGMVWVWLNDPAQANYAII